MTKPNPEKNVTIEALVPAHPHAFYDLGIEPWVPVETTSGTAEWGLVELLRRSHEVVELRIGDPLERFALLRYLLAITYLAYAYDPDGDWTEATRGGALPSAGVEAVIERMSQAWWLFHPTSPFLQVPSLRTNMSKRFTEKDDLASATEGFECIVPFRPAKTNEVWWYKPDGRGLSYQGAALTLLSRHYAAVPGNEAGVLGSEKSRCEGGLMLCGNRDVTNLFVGSSTLARTLVGNLMDPLTDRVTAGSSLFFEDPLGVAEHLDDPLYLYTASGGAALLVWPGEDSDVTRVLRAPLPVGAESAKALMRAARLADPHVLRMRQAVGAPDGDNPNKGLVVFSATATQFENVFALYKRSTDGVTGLRDCVVQPRARRFPEKSSATSLTGITISGGGTEPGARIEGVAQVELDPSPLQLGPGQARSLSLLVGRLAGGKDSCLCDLLPALTDGASRPGEAAHAAARPGS